MKVTYIDENDIQQYVIFKICLMILFKIKLYFILKNE